MYIFEKSQTGGSHIRFYAFLYNFVSSVQYVCLYMYACIYIYACNISRILFIYLRIAFDNHVLAARSVPIVSYICIFVKENVKDVKIFAKNLILLSMTLAKVHSCFGSFVWSEYIHKYVCTTI